MSRFRSQDPAGTSVAPEQAFKSSEYELADQDSDRDRGIERPDLRGPRGNPAVDQDDVRRGRAKLERVLSN